MSRTLKPIFASLFFVGFALMGTVPAHARQEPLPSGTPLSASDKKHLLEDNFVIVNTVSALPKGVQRLIVGTSIRGGMADAGQPFEMSDMVGPKPLPSARLIFAGTAPAYCVVYNEHGGFGYWTQVSLYRVSAENAALVWLSLIHI